MKAIVLLFLLFCLKSLFCLDINQEQAESAPPYDKGATLLPGFRTLAKRVANENNTLLVTFTNMGYAHFVDNMLTSLERHGVKNILVIALDNEAKAHFDSKNSSVACYFPEVMGSVKPESQLFNAEDYKKMMYIRLKVL